MEKIEFHKYCPLILIVLTKCGLYCLYMVFWSFFGTMISTKDNFCFHEPIFHRQIKLISYRSEFWRLRRKPAFLFSKQPFFQNSLIIPWATYSGKMQVKMFFSEVFTKWRIELKIVTFLAAQSLGGMLVFFVSSNKLTFTLLVQELDLLVIVETIKSRSDKKAPLIDAITQN